MIGGVSYYTHTVFRVIAASVAPVAHDLQTYKTFPILTS